MSLFDRIAELFDEHIGYSISLTRLVDGESTYTLTVEREQVGEFPGYDEASERLREIKLAHRASAVRQIMRELLVPARDELCRAADIVEHLGRSDQAQVMRRRADDIRAALSSEVPRPKSEAQPSASALATDEPVLPEASRHADGGE